MSQATRPLQLLLLTRRHALVSFFETLPGVAVHAAAEPPAELTGIDVACVDIGLEPELAVDVCVELHERLATLPLVALVCCPQAVNPWQLERLVRTGVGSVLDLQVSASDALRTLETASRGGFVLHLHLRRGHRRFLQNVLVGGDARRESRVRALELVACGYSDREIAAALHLSPHTVKHRVEALRAEVGARNRTELAAWAGRHGFYRPESDDVVPVRLPHPADRRAARPGRNGPAKQAGSGVDLGPIRAAPAGAETVSTGDS
jgi:DNA-binding NarL/FixJ family response regulator